MTKTYLHIKNMCCDKCIEVDYIIQWKHANYVISSFSTFGAIAMRSSVTLPIKLQSFTGTNDHCTDVLHWKTSYEQNINYFDIQYSSDGTYYSSFAQVSGINNPLGSAYTWSSPKQSVRGFYRLSIVDNDGLRSFSQIVTLSNPACGGNSWSILTNPVTKDDQITIRINGRSRMQNLKIIISNLPGQKLLTKDVRTYSGLLQLNLPTAGLARGAYMLSVNDGTGNSLGQA